MSLVGEDLKKTEELPGAFPSEDATTANTAARTQQNTKPYPEHDLSAHQNVAQADGANNSGVASKTTSSQTPDARDRTAKPSSLASAANPLSGPAVADDDGFGPDNAPNITEDLKAVGSGAATAATAAAIATRDAAVAVKDAAAPVVSAASEQAMQAAGYAAENAGPAASTAANTVQANAPSVLGGGGTTAANTASPRDVAPEVPSQVKSSIAEAGEAPEAASSRRAVHDKGQVEGELLGYAAEAGVDNGAAGRAQQQQQQPVKKGPRPPPPGGALPRMDSGPLTPSTGTAVVLGTDTERSFPLGSHPVHHGNGAEQDQQAAHSGGSLATDSLRTGGVPETSLGDSESAARRPPPAEDKVPVRRTEEQAVGNGPDAYNTLGSGTPSGVGQ